MYYADHNLVLLLNHSVESIQEEEFLRNLIITAVTPFTFWRSHELAGRNKITRKKFKLYRAFRQAELPAFHFLINLN